MPYLKISIIIPLYNQHKKLLKCLRSIKNQTFQDFEIIIVNDGSTDITPQGLEELTLQFSDSPILHTIHQPNQGAPAARNRGFQESSGQYLLFCDADVIMKPDMLEKMSRVLDENPDISYVYSSFKFGWKKFKLWEFDPERLRQMPYIHTTSLIRQENFSGWDPNLKRLQDWDLWLTMLEQGHIGKWIPEVLFTVKTGGTMSKWIPSFFAKYSRSYSDAITKIKAKHNF